MTEPTPFAKALADLAAQLQPMVTAINAHPFLGPLYRALAAQEEAKIRLRADVQAVAPHLGPALHLALQEPKDHLSQMTVVGIRCHVDELIAGGAHRSLREGYRR